MGRSESKIASVIKATNYLMMEVDYLIIGQGLCGTLLSRDLLREGATVSLIDNHNPNAASMVAGGIINPVTGKRMVRSWMIEELLPFAQKTYDAFGAELGVSLVKECPILDIHATQEGRNLFMDHMSSDSDYLHETEQTQWSEYFRFNYGVNEIAPCLLVDMQLMIACWREKLQAANAITEDVFDSAEIIVAADHVIYKDIKAKRIIFCDGAGAAANPYFDMLPWTADKGEALIVSIPGLPRNNIYKQGISIVPWKDDLFWVGASHDWKYTDMQPSAAYRQSVESQLNYWLKVPYTIEDHLVARRPANMERKPFAGLHPLFPVVGIFNGMGGKGVSMAPYFARELAAHLVHGTPLTPAVDVRRFARILSTKNYG
jgi:glycine/D-amino acid oxidase-like deaminating enzyme